METQMSIKWKKDKFCLFIQCNKILIKVSELNLYVLTQRNQRVNNNNKREAQWKQKLVIWEHKQNWWTFSKANQEKKKERTKIIKIRNERRVTTTDTMGYKNYKRILWTVICQQIGKI